MTPRGVGLTTQGAHETMVEHKSGHPDLKVLAPTIRTSERLNLPRDDTSTLAPKINIMKVKEFAEQNLPRGSILRRLLLKEKTKMDRNEFLAKMDLWLKLLSMEFS